MKVNLRNVSFLGVPRVAASTGRSYTQVSIDTFESGGANGSTYSTSAVSGWSVTGDFGVAPRIWTPQNGGKAIRFATSAEGGGSGNSLFRVQNVISASYMSTNLMTVEGRVDFDTKTPTSGGFTAQTALGFSVAQAAMLTVGNTARWHVIGFRSATTIGIWTNSTAGDSAMPAAATLPAASTVIGSVATNTWFPVSFRWKLDSSAGYLELYWNGTKVVEITGNTSFNSGANAVGACYVNGLCGATSQNTDLDYFGALDNVATYRVT